jgi:hypothetical protein
MNPPSLQRIAPGAIVVAACDNLRDAAAMMNWLRPTLDHWPRSSWTGWLANAVDCAQPQACLIGEDGAPSRWRNVDSTGFDRHGEVCRAVGGRAGLIILTYPAIAREVVRHLDGLVAQLICIDMADAAAQPFRRPFAEFGVAA